MPSTQPPADMDDGPLAAIERRGLYAVIPNSAAGRALVCVHGGPGDAHDYFRPHLDALTGRRVVYYDQRGAGRSQAAPADFGLAEHARDLGELVRALGSADVLAFSWGVLVALAWASANVDAVEKLVLVAPVDPTRYPVDGAAFARAAARPAVRAVVEALPADSLERRFAERVAPVLGDPSAALRLRPVEFRASPDPRAASLGFDVPRACAALRGKAALVIEGELDLVSGRAAHAIAAALAAERVVIPGVGHAPFAEAPEIFLSAVNEFLARD
ncbi:MAG: alpha/beta fold hydrolase [Polyangiaceae bacterium]